MKKLSIAVIFGGCSAEYAVSLESASGVLEHLDKDRFCPVPIGITREGDWLYFPGSVEQIRQDDWQRDGAPCCLCPDRGSHQLIVYQNGQNERIPIDAVLPALHGRNGEDGTMQGLCELAGLPVVGCGTLASALSMDKERAHALVSLCGVRVPASSALGADHELGQAYTLAKKLGYPLFVKPVKAGSSFGVAKVERQDDLAAAIANAFHYDDRVLLEENIPGFEVGCAVMGNEQLYTGELDEIELAQGFFDFTEKYHLVTSRIHVPARVSPAKAVELKQAAQRIYRALDCRGFARVDMFLTPDGEIVFNEVNTIPGFTPHSRFPSMMQAGGLPLTDVLTRAIELALEKPLCS